MKRRCLTLGLVSAVLAVGAVAAASDSASAAPPVLGCPTGFSLVTVEFVMAGAGLTQPDPSMDPNADGMTCLKLLFTGSGVRATWHDNTAPLGPF